LTYNDLSLVFQKLSKKVTDNQKIKIKDLFIKGSSITKISENMKFSVQTISKQLKIILGDKYFQQIKKSNSKKIVKNKEKQNKGFPNQIDDKSKLISECSDVSSDDQEIAQFHEFYEIVPISEEIDYEVQKDISSKPIDKIKFPKTVYLVVGNNIELEPKLLKDHPKWSFLPKEDLNRSTIEIFSDQKLAKMNCNKNQKLLKVPNPDVFLKASKILRSKGITRILFEDLLLSI